MPCQVRVQRGSPSNKQLSGAASPATFVPAAPNSSLFGYAGLAKPTHMAQQPSQGCVQDAEERGAANSSLPLIDLLFIVKGDFFT